MEEQVLQWMKKTYRRKISLKQLILEMKLNKSEKLQLLGSVKYFKQLQRNYEQEDGQVVCMLEMA